MRKYRAKTIQADFGIFAHIAAFSDRFRHIQSDIIRHIQAYSEPCITLTYSEPWQIQNQRHIQNLDVFKTLAYPEPWFVQNQRHIQDPDIFRTKTYLESQYIQDPDIFRTLEHFAKIVSILYEINTMNVFNTGVILPQQHLLYVEKVWGHSRPGAMNFNIPIIARKIKQILICSEIEIF